MYVKQTVQNIKNIGIEQFNNNTYFCISLFVNKIGIRNHQYEYEELYNKFGWKLGFEMDRSRMQLKLHWNILFVIIQILVELK